MAVELLVPSLGESITEVQIARWIVEPGQHVAMDEPIVELESDKVTMEMPAPVSGVVSERLKGDGDDATVGELIGYMEESEAPAETEKTESADKPQAAPAATKAKENSKDKSDAVNGGHVMPAAARALAENDLKAEDVSASGPGGRLLKEDVQRHLEKASTPASTPAPASEGTSGREVRRVRMTAIRRKIAERLVDAQQGAALLTTFNEADMSAIMALRKQHQDRFVERHGVKLGFMSFFIKAVVDALQLIPEINAQIEGDQIVYHDYCDIGVAVGSGKGLVVPVLRSAETMSFSKIEKTIVDFAKRASANQIQLSELQGGTFTISNGGVYGSMLSTPIINPPQSGVLGMHNIQKRAVVVDDQIVIRPMMYLALTYDHRIVDGKEAVTFLRRVKDCIEDPERLMLEV